MTALKARLSPAPDLTRDFAMPDKPLTIAFMTVKGIELGGGIEAVTEKLGTKLVQRGHRVIVFSSSQFGSESGFHNGIEIRVRPSILQKHLHKITLFSSSMFPLLWSNVSGAIRSRFSNSISHHQDKFDIIHVHEFSMFSAFPRIVGIPTVVQMHALLWKRAKWGPMSRMFLKVNELTLRLFPNAVTCVSRQMQQHFEKTLGMEATYIPNGVDPPRPKKPDKIKHMGLDANDYILFAARLVPEKGAHYLINAFRKLECPVKLVVAGDDPFEKRYIRSLHEMAENDPRIIFPRYVSGDTYLELITNARLFVLPSEIEGMPVALLEAMSYGRCCIVSDIPENMEALSGHGYTFRNKSVEDLHRVLTLALEDLKTAETYGEEARNYVLTYYSWDRIVSLYEDFYRKVIAESKGSKSPRAAR